MEIQENNSLPFLDVLITRKNNGSLAYQVYRKKTHTDKYLHASSHHVPSQRLGIIKTLSIRVVRIADNEYLDKELNHLYKVLQDNGYNIGDINWAFKKALEKNIKKPDKNDESKGVIFLPYIQRTTDRISRVLKKKHIRTIFSPSNSLRKLLDKTKDPMDSKLKKGF